MFSILSIYDQGSFFLCHIPCFYYLSLYIYYTCTLFINIALSSIWLQIGTFKIWYTNNRVFEKIFLYVILLKINVNKYSLELFYDPWSFYDIFLQFFVKYWVHIIMDNRHIRISLDSLFQYSFPWFNCFASDRESIK